ncbi:MAG TPA: TasA family protein [Actinomycetota bacterium]
MGEVGNEKKRSAGKIGLTLLVLALVGTVAGIGTWSAFSSTTQNAGNEFEAGTVTIGDDDSDGVLFNLTGLTPNDTSDKCIEVTYSGSLPASVTIYGSGSGSLAPYLTLTVTRGTIATPSFPSCTGFTADGGGGELFNGNLSAFPGSFGTGVADTNGSWTNGEAHVYKLSVTVQDDNAAQGLTASQSFTWEARNN